MDEDDILYVDIEQAGINVELDSLRARLDLSDKKNITLELELEEAQAQIQLLLSEKKVLENNILTVYHTALREISRKDREIIETQSKILSMKSDTQFNA